MKKIKNMKHIKLFEDFEDFGRFPIDPNSPVGKGQVPTSVESDEYPKDGANWEDILKKIVNKDDVESLRNLTQKYHNTFRGVSEKDITMTLLRLAIKKQAVECLRFLFNSSLKNFIHKNERKGLVVAWAIESLGRPRSEEILQILADNVDLHSGPNSFHKGKEWTPYQQAELWLSHTSVVDKNEALEKLKELFG